LHAPEGQHALAYALKRGLDADIQETFRIGFAPDRRDGMIGFLKSHDVPVGDMIDAGLVIAPEDGGRAPYDRFRGRLMVAIEDQRGKVVGFGGRVLGDGEPKYLNSPETDLFRKREMLFNAKRARQAAHQNGRLIVVEGYMDAIALHRAGFQEVVASLGTAMGEEQIALMWRFTDEPIICFDGDGAGERAAHRAIDRALPMLKPGKSLKFLFLPKGMDPDDFVNARGADAFEAELSNALPMIEALWARETAGLDVSTPERMAAFQTGCHALSPASKMQRCGSITTRRSKIVFTPCGGRCGRHRTRKARGRRGRVGWQGHWSRWAQRRARRQSLSRRRCSCSPWRSAIRRGHALCRPRCFCALSGRGAWRAVLRPPCRARGRSATR
jgi:DNA primase